MTISLIYLIAPYTIFNNSVPFYQCLSALGYGLLAYSFFLIKKGARQAICVFAFSVMYMSLLRTSFSLLHAIFFCLLFYYYSRGKYETKILAKTCLLMALVLLIVPVKNFILYDFWGSTSWAPLNLARGVGLPQDQFNSFFFVAPQHIKDEFPDLRCKHSYGYQDTALKKGSGDHNFNSCYEIEYAKIVKEKLKNEYSLERHWTNITEFALEYFSSPEGFYNDSRDPRLAKYAYWTSRAQLTVLLPQGRELRLLPFLCLALALVAWFLQRDAFFPAAISIICIHFLTHTLTDGYEARRFVFDIECLFYALFGATMGVFWLRVKRLFSSALP